MSIEYHAEIGEILIVLEHLAEFLPEELEVVSVWVPSVSFDSHLGETIGISSHLIERKGREKWPEDLVIYRKGKQLWVAFYAGDGNFEQKFLSGVTQIFREKYDLDVEFEEE
jgi:hypothetical protein